MRISAAELLVSSSVLLNAVAPAFGDYYIVRQTPVGPCKVVGQQPADTKMIVGGAHRYYKSEAAARKELPLLCQSK